MRKTKQFRPWTVFGMGKWRWHAMILRNAAAQFVAEGKIDRAQEFEDAAKLADAEADEQLEERGASLARAREIQQANAATRRSLRASERENKRADEDTGE